MLGLVRLILVRTCYVWLVKVRTGYPGYFRLSVYVSLVQVMSGYVRLGHVRSEEISLCEVMSR